jgi:cytochrome c-type biogenesis protein CcmF
MERALITRDFTVLYVADNGSTKTPAIYNFATLWGALEGSIILWALILGGYLMAVVVKFRKRLADPLVGWAIFTMLIVCIFFFCMLVGPANPFKSFSPSVGFDGPGPNPLLQNHPLMAFHPPMLYLGYVGFTVPFAFAIAALITGRVGEGWLLATRRWTLIAWGFLTAGILLGSWWSYEVLGWGGYWAWDPVENASLMPWLTGTAYLHSVLVQERRGMLRVWNLSLVIATFSLTILGTFLTRSGVINSVHAFSEGSVGPWLLAFFTIIVVAAVVLIGRRGDQLRSPGAIDSPISREGAFLANNVVFSVFAFVVLLVLFSIRERCTIGRVAAFGLASLLHF